MADLRGFTPFMAVSTAPSRRPDHALRAATEVAAGRADWPRFRVGRQLLDDLADVRSMGPIPVKGKREPVEAFVLHGPRNGRKVQ